MLLEVVCEVVVLAAVADGDDLRAATSPTNKGAAVTRWTQRRGNLQR